MERRTYLTLCGIATLPALAGCAEDDDTEDAAGGDGVDEGSDGDSVDGNGADGEQDGTDEPGDEEDEADNGTDSADENDEDSDDETDDGDLTLGDAFRTPTDLVVTPSGLRFEESYEYEGFDGTEVHESDDGMRFSFVDLEVQNDADETRESPNILDFELIAGDTQYEPLRRTEYEGDDQYDGLNDLTAGVSEAGILPFEIPSDVPDEEIGLFYTGIDFETFEEWEVIWWAA